MMFSFLLTRSAALRRGAGPGEAGDRHGQMWAGSVERLDGHLEVVAGGGDHVQPGVDGAEADQAGLGDGLTVVGVEDRDVVAGRPVGKLSHLVVELPPGPVDAELAGSRPAFSRPNRSCRSMVIGSIAVKSRAAARTATAT